MRTTLRTRPGAVQFTTDAQAQKWAGRGQEVRSGAVTLTIDVAALLEELGGKALFNTGGRARAIRGAIQARARNVKVTTI